MTNKRKTLYYIAYSSMMMAIVFIGTYFIAIPYGGGAGYFNLSDGILLFTTIYFGPLIACISTIGSVIADLVSGYALFAPFTLLAKVIEVIVCFVLSIMLNKTKHIKYLSLIIAPLFMVLTYFISYIILFDINYAYASSLFDLIQGVCGSIVSIILLLIFKNIPNKLKKGNN
ncbi:MAG: ECF transporter S component [Bacilli bacterium]